jgi:hypothetical protein
VVVTADAFPAEYGTFIFHVTAGILFGLAPALESSAAALSSALKANAGTAKLHSRRMRDFLMAAQVAVSLVLLIAGSMLIRSSIRALQMDTGYDSNHVVSLELRFPEEQKYSADRQATLVRELRNAASCPAWRGCDYQCTGAGRRRVSNGGCFAEWRKALATKCASQPAGECCHSERIGCAAAVAGTEPHRPRPAPGTRGTVPNERRTSSRWADVRGDRRGSRYTGSYVERQ